MIERTETFGLAPAVSRRTCPTHLHRAAALSTRLRLGSMHTSSWIIEVVRVSSRAKQQEVLSHFPGCEGLTAAGVSAGPDYFVVLGCVDKLFKDLSDIVISDIDPGAICDYLSASPSQINTLPWQIPEEASSPN